MQKRGFMLYHIGTIIFSVKTRINNVSDIDGYYYIQLIIHFSNRISLSSSVKISMFKKVFSVSILLIYSVVIFQDGLFQGGHFLSHATEIFSKQFSFHQHGTGKYHIHHHHGFLESVKALLSSGEDQKDRHDQQNMPENQKLFKIHLAENLLELEYLIGRSTVLHANYLVMLKSNYLEVLTPPPKV